MQKTTLIAAFSVLFSCTSAAEQLPNLELNTDNTTVSGLSSGGYMATQFHLANSDWVTGIGLIGTGPYFCAQGDIGTALSQCVSKMETPVSASQLAQQAEQYAGEGKLPALSNLANSKVWLLHGTGDTTVTRAASDALFAQYSQWTAAENLAYVTDKPFAHHFPTVDNGTACSDSASPFIGNCGYDAAGELLQHLYAELSPRSEHAQGTLYTIDQQELGDDAAASLADEGYLYVPQSCESEACRVHISFHGCNQNAEAVGDTYATQTGLNEWADNNQLVVLYPQTKKSLFMPLNPQACWDWWGYTGEDYANQHGQQIMAVKNIVHSLVSPQKSN